MLDQNLNYRYGFLIDVVCDGDFSYNLPFTFYFSEYEEDIFRKCIESLNIFVNSISSRRIQGNLEEFKKPMLNLLEAYNNGLCNYYDKNFEDVYYVLDNLNPKNNIFSCSISYGNWFVNFRLLDDEELSSKVSNLFIRGCGNGGILIKLPQL